MARLNGALKRKIFILSAPSGTGKTTIIRAVLDSDTELRKIVTTTSRPPRNGEVNHDDYHFVNRAAFERLIKADQLVEWKQHFGNYYGVERSEVAKEPNRHAIFDMDVLGKGEFIDAVSDDCVTIFLAPPSLDAIETRIRGRGELTQEQALERVGRAVQEFELADTYDYVVVNQTVRSTVAEVKDIIRRSTATNADDSAGFVAIEGLIAAGKTTLAQIIAASTGARLYLDPYEDNPFLRDFYLSRRNFALETELTFLLLRARLLMQLTRDLTANRWVVGDFTLWRSDVFAQVNLDKAEYRLFRRVYEVMERRSPMPSLVIWIEAEDSLVVKRIRTRGRPEEILGVGSNYLEQLRASYGDLLKSLKNVDVTRINARSLDLTRRNQSLSGIIRKMKNGN